MTVLVAYASRAGATRGVAERIGTRMRENGLDVHLDPLLGREQVWGFQAVVVGSPIYSGKWERVAVDFFRRNAPALVGRAVWTFSVGWPARGEQAPVDAKNLGEVHAIAPPRDHRLFLGALDAAELRALQRLTFRLRGGRARDFRDWAAIDARTDALARQLTATPRAR